MYNLYKVFDYKQIPTGLIDHLKYGHCVQFCVNLNSKFEKSRKLSEFLVQKGATDSEKIFIFND